MSSSGPADDRLVLTAQWHDERASLVRHFLLSYFVDDNSVELYEPKLSRVFLRRSCVDQLSADELYLGSRLTLLGRQIVINGYANLLTRRLLEDRAQRTFAMVKPDGVARLGEILHTLSLHGLRVINARMVQLTRSEAEIFYKEHAERAFFSDLICYISSGPVVALELMGRQAVTRWRQLMGPTDSETARRDNPDSIRAQFGTNKTNNAVHGSDSEAAAERELQLFFPGDEETAPPSSPAQPDEATTCAIIKPHVVRDGLLGQLLTAVQTADPDLQLTGLRLVRLTPQRARQFLEPYRGVVPEYAAQAAELASGPAVALALRWPCRGAGAVDAFRQVAGPRDPALAALLRPGCLRARFGRDRVRNALHCTDLAGDGALECSEFFGEEADGQLVT